MTEPTETETVDLEKANDGGTEPESATVLVTLVSPVHVREFVDGKVAIDRRGALVRESDVAPLVAAASAAGIGLKVG